MKKNNEKEEPISKIYTWGKKEEEPLTKKQRIIKSVSTALKIKKDKEKS